MSINYGELAREIILDLYVRGLINQQIADGAGVSIGTVESIARGNDALARTYARLRAYAQERAMTTDTKIRIIPVEGPIDRLCIRYGSQSDRQAVYLEVDLDNATITVAYNTEIGNAVTMDVWHGRTNRYGLIGIPTPEAANELMKDALPLVRRMVAGYETYWDGSNNVGRYTTADACAADDEMTALCEAIEHGAKNRNGVDDRDAADWFGTVPAEDLGVYSGMTDEELEALEEKLQTEALDEHHVVLHHLDHRLQQLRDELDEVTW